MNSTSPTVHDAARRERCRCVPAGRPRCDSRRRSRRQLMFHLAGLPGASTRRHRSPRRVGPPPHRRRRQVLVLATAVVGVRSAATRRVTALAATALVLYPVQIGLGALVATSGSAGPSPALISPRAWPSSRRSSSRSPGNSDPRRGRRTTRRRRTARGRRRRFGSRRADAEARCAVDARANHRDGRGLLPAHQAPPDVAALSLVAAAGMALAAGPSTSRRRLCCSP